MKRENSTKDPATPKGLRRGRPDRVSKQRNALLAKVHIAIKDLNIPDCDYRDILEREFFVSSAAELNLDELERLVRRFRDCGWAPKAGRRKKGQADPASQKVYAVARALRDRARAMAGDLENGEKRLKGLVKKICGVDNLDWCRDVGKLKRLVAVLGKID